MALDKPPFGTYVTPTEICIQAAQDEIIALIVAFEAMLPAVVGGSDSSESSSASPDFMDIDRHYVEKITDEMTEIKTLIDAMAVA